MDVQEEAKVVRAEQMLSLLTSTYLANTESVQTHMSLVFDAIQSQNLFEYVGGIAEDRFSEGISKRYASAVNKWVTRVGSLVSSGKTPASYLTGILLMKQTTLQSPTLFVENAGKWFSAILSVLGKPAMAAPVCVASLQTLLLFMDLIREVPVLVREVATPQIPKLNQLVVVTLSANRKELMPEALGLMTYSALWYPAQFRPFIEKTENICLEQLQLGSSYVEATTCLASLPKVGGKVAPESRWLQYTQQALRTIDLCVSHIMCEEIDDVEGAFKQLPSLADDYIVSIPQAAQRAEAMCEILVALFTRPLDGCCVSVPVDSIISACTRLCLVALRTSDTSSRRAEHGTAAVVTGKLQRAAIRVVAALNMMLGDHLLPFLPAIGRMMGTVDANAQQSNNSPNTRVALYTILRLYIDRYGYGFASYAPYSIIESVSRDISVQKPKQSTTLPAITSNSFSKKRANNNYAALSNSSASSSGLNIQWTDVKYSALLVLHSLLKRTPAMVGGGMRTKVDAQILSILLTSQQTNGFIQPFGSRRSDSRFRELLCRCLLASVQSPDPWQRAIVPHAVSVFTAGMSDPSMAVRQACLEGMAAVEPLVHSKLPAQLRAPETKEENEYENLVPRSLFNKPKESKEEEEEKEEMEVESTTKRFKHVTVAEPGTPKATDPPEPVKEPKPEIVIEPKVVKQLDPPTEPPLSMTMTMTTTTTAPNVEEEQDSEGEDSDIPDIVMDDSDSDAQ